MKRSLTLMLVFLLLFSNVALAYGPGDFTISKIEKNGQGIYEYTQSNFIFNPELDRIRTLFSKVAEALNAILVWDDTNNTIQLIQPNVQMITASMVGKDEKSGNLVILAPFGKVKKGDKLDKFYVYTEIDGLPNEELELRLIIDRPGKLNEKEFVVSPGTATNKEKDTVLTSRWVNFEVANANFSEAGNYKLKLQMRFVDSKKMRNGFYTIAEKTIKVFE